MNTERFTPEYFKPRVAKGVDKLDEKNPGWFHDVNPDLLEMDSADACILGLLYGWYFSGLRALSVTDGTEFGYNIDFEESDCDEVRSEAWHTLLVLWLDVIDEKRKAS
ncbi:hypothetical protein FDA94_28710 [Herbidospora galbida]|uniref:Uncharacterized protein n=1 Tax=Herbidospora galbida TaxID=2575442 RepID=A0A4V5UYF5_9ACTN|nr:hypothetical protein [Herbidospora galbida]TKK84613.1 hypothetical protein FDA94_28710 [Herbidospora galbida]